jgi:carbamoyltransferase
MYIMGNKLHFHDASAALIKDGKLVAAAEEERFTRRSTTAHFR